MELPVERLGKLPVRKTCEMELLGKLLGKLPVELLGKHVKCYEKSRLKHARIFPERQVLVSKARFTLLSQTLSFICICKFINRPRPTILLPMFLHLFL